MQLRELVLVSARPGSNVFHIMGKDETMCGIRKTYPPGEAGKTCPKCRRALVHAAALVGMSKDSAVRAMGRVDAKLDRMAQEHAAAPPATWTPTRLGMTARTFIQRAPSSPEQDAAARDAIALRLAYRRAVTSLGVVMEGYRLAMILGGQSPAAFDASPEVVEARAILAIAEANR